MGYLNNDGLVYVWDKAKAKFVEKESGKGLSTNDYTTAEKTKLSGIAANATNNTVENVLTSTSTTNALSAAQGKELKALIDAKGTGDMLKSTYDADGDGVVDNAAKVNGKTVAVDVPANAKFTDTVYTHPTSAGNKHIPSGGASGQILKYSAPGTAVWADEKDTTYDEFTATEAGLVPAPTADYDDHDYFLAGSGQWRKLWGEVARDASRVYVGVFAGGSNNVMDSSGSIPAADSSYAGIMSAAQAGKLDALPTNETLESTYAKKTDITGVYKYKGSVATVNDLPATDNTTGDVYNVEARGINYAWDGTKWDNLGELFTVETITNAQIDTICV